MRLDDGRCLWHLGDLCGGGLGEIGYRALMERLWRAFKRRRFERAVRRAFRANAPNPLVAQVAGRLVERLRLGEAEVILEAALGRTPCDRDLVYQHAMCALYSGDAERGLPRWERLRELWPDLAMSWTGLSATLRQLGRLEAAEATIRGGLDRFPDDLVVAAEAARVFDRLGRHDEAVGQWGRLLEKGFAYEEVFQGQAYSLMQLNRFAEAHATLDRATQAYPDSASLLATRGFLAMAMEDWTKALAIWRVYRERYPDDQTGWENQGKTVTAIQLARSEAAEQSLDDDVLKVHIETVANDANRTLLLGFESIGTDCEFGLVQRRFGAEPLGLLRFNNVQLHNLILALEAGFERMGDPALTALNTSVSGEYYVTDLRWNLGMHTFLFSSQHEAASLLPKMCRRVAYLRDKMLEDLREARKVFVYKGDGIDLDGLRVLHRHLRAFGPVRLLHVRQASVPLTNEPVLVKPGEVFMLEPDLYVGFLGRMGNARPEWDIAFDEWISICGKLDAAPAFPVAPPLAEVLG